MKYPNITILIPIRNVAKYIGECLDALLNQTYPQDKYEIWLLDNNSDDGTLDIVAQYPQNMVKVIQIGVHSPPMKYNKVMPKIKNKIIGFVDGDANVGKRWLEKVIEPLENPKVAGASGVILTANKDKLIPRIIGYELQDRYGRMPREIKRVATMHVVYKKNVLEKLGGFLETSKTGYDSDIGHRINNAGYKIINIPEAIVYHNHRENLWAFFKQQYEYGKFGLVRFFKMPKIAKGDSVTSFWMIVQPFLYLVSLIFALMWIFLKTPIWLIFIPLLIMLIQYFYSAIRLSIKYRDVSAVFSIIIYIIRPWGWGIGALFQIPNLLKSYLKSKST